MDWKDLKIECRNEKCDGELDLRKMRSMESKPSTYRYLGRRFWTHGYRCPSCGRTLWLQRDMWFRRDYETSPIPTWDLFGYLIAISVLAMPLGLVVRTFADFAGFLVFVLGATCAFIGGGAVTWKDMQKVKNGKARRHDYRLFLPFFTTAALIPILYFTTDSETVLMWGIVGGCVMGYAVGSLVESERGQVAE
jgi:hypothetical protein